MRCPPSADVLRAECDSQAAPSAIRAQLDRIVGSPEFRNSPRLKRFLTFVVEMTLEGKAERIKAYTIAIEALGRGPEFDPQIDPIIRVQAGRLRQALGRYYANAGRNDPVVIEMPRGAYVPSFRGGGVEQPDRQPPHTDDQAETTNSQTHDPAPDIRVANETPPGVLQKNAAALPATVRNDRGTGRLASRWRACHHRLPRLGNRFFVAAAALVLLAFVFAIGRPWQGATTAGALAAPWPAQAAITPAPRAGPTKTVPETHYRFAATATYDTAGGVTITVLCCRVSGSEAPESETARRDP